jgi:hypothetical protein
MMRRDVSTATLTVTTIMALSFLVAAQSKDAWLGTWQLDVTRSKFDGPGFQSGTFTVEELGGGAQKHIYDNVGANGGKNHQETTTKFDGTDSPVVYPNSAPPRASRTDTYRRIDDHTYEITTKIDGEIRGMSRTVVSADGKTLTQTITGKGPDGKPIHNIAVHTKK